MIEGLRGWREAQASVVLLQFTEESCSFSQSDLLGSLQMWLDKARGQLELK
jgi:hypothetical protein